MKRNSFSLLSFIKLKDSIHCDLEPENCVCVCVCVMRLERAEEGVYIHIFLSQGLRVLSFMERKPQQFHSHSTCRNLALYFKKVVLFFLPYQIQSRAHLNLNDLNHIQWTLNSTHLNAGWLWEENSWVV